MANPIIMVNSTAGGASDTLCSGAGPGDGVTSGSALTGTAGATNATGQTVTLDGSPDLTNVATDGSHVLLFIDATAGDRNFTTITGKDNTAKTLTASPALAANLTGKSWAVGGVRATALGAQSLKVFTNNNAAGDAVGGWTVRMLSAHAESVTTVLVKAVGSQTAGPVVLEGLAGAATRPVITNTGNTNGLNVSGTSVVLRHFAMKNSNATKTASVDIQISGPDCTVYDVKMIDSTNKAWRGMQITSAATNSVVEACEIANRVDQGIALTGGACQIHNNKIYSNGFHGLSVVTGIVGIDITDNVIYSNAGDGLNLGQTGALNAMMLIAGNTIHGNVASNINFTGNITTNLSAFRGLVVQNNNITGALGTSSGGYGINFSSGAVTTAALQSLNARIRNNNFGTGATANGNTAASAGVTLDASNVAVDPGYANTSAGDFTPGTNIVNLGFPSDTSGNVAGSCRSFYDIGLQKQYVTGGGGGGIIAGFGTTAFTGDTRA